MRGLDAKLARDDWIALHHLAHLLLINNDQLQIELQVNKKKSLIISFDLFASLI